MVLELSDIIKKAGLHPSEVMLIRHPLSNKRFATCYEKDFFYEYTCHQDIGFSDKFKYWLVFIGDKVGTMGLLKGAYEVVGALPSEQAIMPDGYPFMEDYEAGHEFCQLEPLSLFDDLVDRLIIDWGTGTRSWHQSALKEKRIVAIQQQPKARFPGYEKVLLPYSQLKDIIDDRITYSDWHTALSSIYAIYLITDQSNGKQYVGSAYGADGLLGRWRKYVETGHGNNIELVEALKANPEQYTLFQFSILQVLPKNMSADMVIEAESAYKDKLLTRQFGMNSN